jgi:CRISPR type III-B/RAMP module RAMP protein Cmr1
MSKLTELQGRLLESQNLVLRVKATLLCPHVGGYSTLPFDPATNILEPPRPTELKALWRWWARVLLSAACGGEKNYEELDEKVGKILGRTGEKALSSLIMLRISISNLNDAENLVKKSYYDHLQSYEIIANRLRNLLEDFIRTNSKTKSLPFLDVKYRSFRSIDIIFKGNCKDIYNVFRNFNLKIKYENGLHVLSLHSSKDIRKLKQIANKIGKNYKDLFEKLEKYFTYGTIARIFMISQPRKGEDENQEAFKRKLAAIAAVHDMCKQIKLNLTIDVLKSFDDKISLKGLKFALYSFLISLVFGSIGYASRRGFGSLVIEEISEGPILNMLSIDIKDFTNKIVKLKNEKLPERIEKTLWELLQEAYQSAREYAESCSEREDPGIPVVPAAPLEGYFRVKVFRCKDVYQALCCISKATLKEEWRALAQGKARRVLHTWILGLPRAVGGCGYFLDKHGKEPGRRPSAIHFKLFENKYGTFIIVYGFLSKDWPIDSSRTIYHIRRIGKKEKVSESVKEIEVAKPNKEEIEAETSEELLYEVFDAAFMFISNVINQCKCGEDSHADK